MSIIFVYVQQFLKKITVAHPLAGGGDKAGPDSPTRNRSQSRPPEPETEGSESDSDAAGGSRDGDGDGDGDGRDRSGNGSSRAEGGARKGGVAGSSKPIVIHGYQLAALFKRRPELAEFIHLEIENMKLATPSHGRNSLF